MAVPSARGGPLVRGTGYIVGRKFRQVVYSCLVGLLAIAAASGLAFLAIRILGLSDRSATVVAALVFAALIAGILVSAIAHRLAIFGAGARAGAQPRYRRLARSNYVGIVLSDSSGTIIKANEAFA